MRRAAARGLALARSIFDLELSAIGLRLQPALTGHEETVKCFLHCGRSLLPQEARALLAIWSGSYPGSMSAGLLTAAKLLFITWVYLMVVSTSL